MGTSITSGLGRFFIAAIFLMSGAFNKIPNYSGVVELVASKGVPMPGFAVFLATVLLIAGSLSVIAGYRTRYGAIMLIIFLLGATYYFHDFWNKQGAEAEQEMIAFLKNVSLIGTMLFLFSNGAGKASLDSWLASRSSKNK